MPETLGLGVYQAQLAAQAQQAQQHQNILRMMVETGQIRSQSQIDTQNKIFGAIDQGISQIAAANMRAATLKFQAKTEAEQQAARDARLHEYDKQRYQWMQERDQAKQLFEATGGFTAGDISKMAAESALKGPPMSELQVRDMLIQQKQTADIQSKVQANYEARLGALKAGKDYEHQRDLQDISQMEASLKELPNNKSLSPQAKEMMASRLQQAIWAKKSGLPQYATPSLTSSLEKVEGPDGTFLGYAYPDSKGNIKIVQPRNVGGAAGQKPVSPGASMADLNIEDDDIDKHLEMAQKLDPGSWMMQDGVTMRPVTDDDRNMARLSILASRIKGHMLSQIAQKKQLEEGYSPEDAVRQAVVMYDEMNSNARLKDFATKQQIESVTREMTKFTKGRNPVPAPPEREVKTHNVATSQPGQSTDPGKAARIQAVLSDPNVPQELKRQIIAQIGQ
jgi:hypothetical protein